MQLGRNDKDIVIIIVAILLGFAYCLSITSVYSSYLNARGDDPLAMIHVLFPSYFVIIFAFTVLCFYNVFYGTKNSFVYVILLVEFSLMLWFTPYYLSGFSRHIDSIFHTAASAKIPEILQKDTPPSAYMYEARYGQEYPTSFMLNYAVMTMTGIDIFTYSRLIYPIFNSIAIAVLWYIFATRLFGEKAGFLSTVVAMLGLMGGIELHVSPHSLGTVLALTAATLLVTGRSSRSLAMGLFVSFLCILAHPISPIILVILLIAPYVVKIFIQDLEGKLSSFGIYGVFSIILVWFGWAFYNATSTGNKIAEALVRVVTLRFASELEELSKTATTTTWYVFPEINLLSKIFRYGLIAIAVVFLFRGLVSTRFEKTKKKLVQVGNKIGQKRLMIFTAAALCLALSSLLVFAAIQPGTGMFEERSYEWFVFLAATFIATDIIGTRGTAPFTNVRFAHAFDKELKLSILIWFLFASLVYPIVAFKDEASMGYPPSEKIGIEFISLRIALNNQTISMYSISQLTPYVNLTTHFHYLQTSTLLSSSNFLGLGNESSPDVIVFRKTMFYMVAFTYDLFFDNNRYTRALRQVNDSNDYNKIYSSPTFEIYVRG